MHKSMMFWFEFGILKKNLKKMSYCPFMLDPCELPLYGMLQQREFLLNQNPFKKNKQFYNFLTVDLHWNES